MEIIIEAWRQFQLKDLIDILVVAFVLYQFLKVVRGTRSMQMVIGLFLLSFISIVGKYYDLYSISWLLENFFESFIIILVILFQSEIRAALIAFANRKTFGAKRSNENKEIETSEIIEAVWALREKKLGAIIAMQNSESLGHISNTGALIDAKINRELLISIFNPKSPLHDGAVIIQDERIAAASCFIPINNSSSKHFGARHLAASDLSNSSDALVILISEETGQVKIFFEGKMIDIHDMFSLKRYIKYLWGNGDSIEDLLPSSYQEIKS